VPILPPFTIIDADGMAVVSAAADCPVTSIPPSFPAVPSDPTLGSRRPDRLTVLLGDEADAAEAWHRTATGLLAAQGVTTLVARTGREALALIEGSALGRGPRIHVAVLDQHMPVIGGLQILRRIQRDLREAQQRAERRGQALPQAVPAVPPAILLADTLAAATMHEALMVQVFSVLPRPVELNLLLDTLARALKRFYQNKWPQGRNEE
jgi:CheY-like chemotaxis protein